MVINKLLLLLLIPIVATPYKLLHHTNYWGGELMVDLNYVCM